MNKNRFGVFVIVFVLLIVTAAWSQDEPGHFYLYPKKSTIWISPIIPVCWENPSNNFTNEMLWVQEAVSNSWQKESAVNLIGWNKCSSAGKGIRIFINDEGPHTKGLGSELDGKQKGMVLNFSFNNWSQDCKSTKEYCIKTIAIHEFGHALGFAHEQNRPDTPATLPGSTKKWCTEERQGSDGDILIGRWDLNSVMNYCNPEWSGNGKLSQTDIEGVRKLYGSKKEEGTVLYITPFDGKTFGAVAATHIVSKGYGWRGWSWNGSTASYIAVNSKGETILYICPFDGKTFGAASATHIVSKGDGWRGWSWDGSTASYIAVNSKGETVLYICPFDGKTFGPVSATHIVSSGDGWRGWSWNGSTASYIAVNSKGETVLYIRPFDGKIFGPVSATHIVSSGDGWSGWSWNGSTASYIATKK